MTLKDLNKNIASDGPLYTQKLLLDYFLHHPWNPVISAAINLLAMPNIEYKDNKIIRHFTPAWKRNVETMMPQHVDSFSSQNDKIFDYIELLHDEIDRLNRKLEVVKDHRKC